MAHTRAGSFGFKLCLIVISLVISISNSMGANAQMNLVEAQQNAGGGSSASVSYSLSGGAQSFSQSSLPTSASFRITPASLPASSATVPDAPVITGIITGDEQLTVEFTQGSDGGSPITNYEYSLNGGAWVPFSPAITASPATITGLANGTAYSVTVTATNGVGTSVASASSNSLTPAAPATPVPTLPLFGSGILVSLLGLLGLRKLRQ